jgi:hypothetical protein
MSDDKRRFLDLSFWELTVLGFIYGAVMTFLEWLVKHLHWM